MESKFLEQLKMISFFFSLLSTILICTSCAGHVWIKNEYSTEGLWKECFGSSCKAILDVFNSEGRFKQVPQWFEACRACVIVACIVCVVGFISLMLTKTLISALLSFMSCLFMVIANSLFAENIALKTLVDFSYGWSYVCAWIGCLFVFTAGLLALLGVTGFIENLKQRIHFLKLFRSVIYSVFLIIIASNNNWFETSIVHQGLWLKCQKNVGCNSITNVTPTLIICRLFFILSCLSSIASVVLDVITLKIKVVKKYLSSVCLLISSVLLLISLSSFTANNYPATRYGWCLMVGWIFCIVTIELHLIGFAVYFHHTSFSFVNNLETKINFRRLKEVHVDDENLC